MRFPAVLLLFAPLLCLCARPYSPEWSIEKIPLSGASSASTQPDSIGWSLLSWGSSGLEASKSTVVAAGNSIFASGVFLDRRHASQFLCAFSSGGDIPFVRLAKSYFPLRSSLDVDSASNVYFAGSAQGAIEADGGFRMAGRDDSSGRSFIIKYDSNGNLLWGKPLTAGSNAIIRDIVVAPDDSLYIAGSFRGELLMDSTPLFSAGPSDEVSAFLLKLTSEGVLEWAKQWSVGRLSVIGKSLTCDGSGCIDFLGNISRGLLSSPPPQKREDYVIDIAPQVQLPFSLSVEEDCTFVAKLGQQGDIIMSRLISNIGSDNNVTGDCIACDGNGNVYIAGRLNYDPLSNYSVKGFVCSIDGAGQERWQYAWRGDMEDVFLPREVGEHDFLPAAGRFEDSLIIDVGDEQRTVTSNGEHDIVVLAFDADGNFAGLKRWGGPGDDTVGRPCIMENGNILLPGGFEQTVDFGDTGDERRITSRGSKDCFLMIIEPQEVHE